MRSCNAYLGTVWARDPCPGLEPVCHPLHDDEPLESRLRFHPSRLCPSELGAGAINGTLLRGCLIPEKETREQKIKDWAIISPVPEE